MSRDDLDDLQVVRRALDQVGELDAGDCRTLIRESARDLAAASGLAVKHRHLGRAAVSVPAPGAGARHEARESAFDSRAEFSSRFLGAGLRRLRDLEGLGAVKVEHDAAWELQVRECRKAVERIARSRRDAAGVPGKVAIASYTGRN